MYVSLFYILSMQVTWRQAPIFPEDGIKIHNYLNKLNKLKKKQDAVELAGAALSLYIHLRTRKDDFNSYFFNFRHLKITSTLSMVTYKKMSRGRHWKTTACPVKLLEWPQ